MQFSGLCIILNDVPVSNQVIIPFSVNSTTMTLVSELGRQDYYLQQRKRRVYHTPRKEP